MVFYRKYRPQKIEELDNAEIRESLYSIFSKGNFPHAFLFTGPKGLGKTSAARIIAKVINCQKHLSLKGHREEKEIEPCNKCEQCLSITNGNNLDVLEIDAASNRGIDEIRDLREKIKLAPFKAQKKVYIIDEVHMLTTEAFNALLKTLEEPPAHAVFILCTTEPHKVPATIVSRCFRVNFTRATTEELVRSMQRVVKAEEIKTDKEALFEIAKIADGSFRDASKILEEVAVFAGRKTVTGTLVNERFKTQGISENLSAMLEAFARKDAKKGLLICKELAKQGMDFKFFIEQLIDKLHLLLLQEVGVEKKDKESELNLWEIQKLFEILTTAYQETKTAILPQMPLELAILEWGEERQTIGQQSHLADDAREDISQNDQPRRSLNERFSPNSANKSVDKVTAFNSSASGLSAAGFFESLINEVKYQNHLIAGVLRGCSADQIQNHKLTITAKSKFHKQKLEEPKTLKLLEEAATKVFGKEISIKISGSA